MENLSSFRYPFLAGVVRCDEAECDGVEAEGRRQDFSEELKFTFKPSILLFKLSNLKIMHCTRYLSHALSASIRHKASVNVTVIIMRNVCLHRELAVWSGRGGSGTGHKTLLSLETFTGRRRWRFGEVDLCVGSIIIVIASTIIDVQGNVRTQTFKEIST